MWPDSALEINAWMMDRILGPEHQSLGGPQLRIAAGTPTCSVSTVSHLPRRCLRKSLSIFSSKCLV